MDQILAFESPGRCRIIAVGSHHPGAECRRLTSVKHSVGSQEKCCSLEGLFLLVSQRSCSCWWHVSCWIWNSAPWFTVFSFWFFFFNRKSVLLNSIEKQASKQTKNPYMDSDIVIINLGAVFSLRFSKDRWGTVHATTFFIILRFAHLLGSLMEVFRDPENRVVITSL